MAVLKTGIARLNSRTLILFARKLINRMTGNAAFADPQPALADIQTKLDEYVSLAVAADDGTKKDRVDRDVAGDELKGLLRILASYVSMTAAGEASIILSSGFDTRNESEPLPPVSIPAALKALRSGKDGIVDVDWDAVTDAVSYQVMMTTDDPSSIAAVWTSVAVTSRSQAEISGLVPGVYYWFKVKAIGRGTVSGFSDPAMIMAA